MLSFLLLSMNVTAALFASSNPGAVAVKAPQPVLEAQMIGADKPVFLGRMVVTATPLPR